MWFVGYSVHFQLVANVFVYGKLRACVRGFSEGKSEAGKQATNFVLAKTSNFLYTVLGFRYFFRLSLNHSDEFQSGLIPPNSGKSKSGLSD